MRLLVIEDNADILANLADYLGMKGYVADCAADGLTGLHLAATQHYDLIVLDVMLPGIDGFSLCERLRNGERRNVPVIMLTARDEENDKVSGLDAGVDDYVVKPFSARELVARIRAVLRRAHGEDAEGVIEIAGLRIDSAAHRVFAGEQTVPIGPTEYRLLHFFMTHPERVYTRSQLLDHVWGGGVYVEERTVDVHIRRLRMTLAPFGKDGLVQTVRGAGYRFSASE